MNTVCDGYNKNVQQTFCSKYLVFRNVNIGPSSSFPGFLAKINMKSQNNGACKF